MKDAKYYPSSILDASTPGPAPAGTILYTVRVNLDNGQVLDVPGVRPHRRGWTEVYGFDVRARPIGDPCEMVEVGGKWLLLCDDELPVVFDCEGVPILPAPIVTPNMPVDSFGNPIAPEDGGGVGSFSGPGGRLGSASVLGESSVSKS